MTSLSYATGISWEFNETCCLHKDKTVRWGQAVVTFAKRKRLPPHRKQTNNEEFFIHINPWELSKWCDYKTAPLWKKKREKKMKGMGKEGKEEWEKTQIILVFFLFTYLDSVLFYNTWSFVSKGVIPTFSYI